MDNPEGYVGLGALSLAFIGFIRFFLWRQIKDLREDVIHLHDKIEELEKKYDGERSLKHKAFNDVARAVMALELVQRLAAACTCRVLAPLEEILKQLAEEFEIPHRRHDDPPIEGA